MVETERSTAKSVVSKVEQQVDEARKKLEDLKETLEKTLTSGLGQAIFDTTVSEPVLKFDSFPDEIKGFIPQKETPKNMGELFGSFEDVAVPTVNPELGFEVLRTFAADLPYVNRVIPLDETSALISCTSIIKPVIRKITMQDNTIVASKELVLSINDMAVTSNNDVLVTLENQSSVKLITASMVIKPFLSVAPLLPKGIHVTNDNQVIIGVEEPKATFKRSGQSQRAVILFDENLKQKSLYEFDENGKKLFTSPDRMTTNNNLDISVIDRASYKTGKVVTLDREGRLKWIYEGHHKINASKQFDPVGIATTDTCYIIVIDYSSNALHVLFQTGYVLTCKDMGDLGVIYPMGVDIDRNGELWVCCEASGKDSEATLHVVKLLEM